MPITYNNLYLDTRQALKAHGAEAATLEARELICSASGKTREELLRDGPLYASPEVEKKARELLQRHLNGEPVAYLIGEWEFYGLELDISEAVLIPRVDTEVLAEEVINYLGDRECRVLDLCAGSGCVGLAIASQAPKARVVLGELSEGALRICRQNIRRNGLSGQVVSLAMDVMAGPPAHMGEFDCIVSNPPYIPRADIATLDVSVRDYEPHMALDGGEDGLDFYRTICRDWQAVMHVGTRVLFEVGVGQADDVLRLMRSAGFGDTEVIADPAGIPRVVCGTLCDSV